MQFLHKKGETMGLFEVVAYLITIVAAIAWVVKKIPKDVWLKIADVTAIVFVWAVTVAGVVGAAYIVGVEVKDWWVQGRTIQRLELINAGLESDLDLMLRQWGNEMDRQRWRIEGTWSCAVTTLEPEGPGSFQWCLDQAAEPEIRDQFKVIRLQQSSSYRMPPVASTTRISNMVWIKGKTAPGYVTYDSIPAFQSTLDSAWSGELVRWIDNAGRVRRYDSVGVWRP